jgi:hypothetical protein
VRPVVLDSFVVGIAGVPTSCDAAESCGECLDRRRHELGRSCWSDCVRSGHVMDCVVLCVLVFSSETFEGSEPC